MFEHVLGITCGFIGFFAILYYIADKSVKSVKETTPDFIKEGKYLIFVEYPSLFKLHLYQSDAVTMADLRNELETLATKPDYSVAPDAKIKAHIVELKHQIEIPFKVAK